MKKLFMLLIPILLCFGCEVEPQTKCSLTHYQTKCNNEWRTRLYIFVQPMNSRLSADITETIANIEHDDHIVINRNNNRKEYNETIIIIDYKKNAEFTKKLLLVVSKYTTDFEIKEKNNS